MGYVVYIVNTLLIGGMVVWIAHIILGPKIDTSKDHLIEIFHNAGFFIRKPKTRWQRYLLLFWSNRQWARRMLGGIWESYVHDIGTRHAIITWHWVEKKSNREKSSIPLFRIEEYRPLVAKEQVEKSPA